jgi:VWFA-related protein
MAHLAWRSGIVAVAGSAALVSLAAQEPPPAQPPVLRASVDHVVVDVLVTDQNGQPVTGLTAADFELLERGKPQTIATFSELSLPFAAQPAGSTPRPASDVRSNVHAGERRVYVLVLDDAGVEVRHSVDVRKAARLFVDRFVQPGDLVGVVVSSGLDDRTQELTEDLSLARAAIDRFNGWVPTAGTAARFNAERNPDRLAAGEDGNESAVEQGQRGAQSLRTLTEVAGALAQAPAGRKAVLFFSPGIPIAPGAWDAADLQGDVRDVVAAAARANVTIYGFDPTGLDHTSEFLDSRARPAELQRTLSGTARRDRGRMLEELTAATGGAATTDTNNPASGLERVARESSHYYLLGYVPANAKRDGRYRSIEVKVRRPELKVRARRGYVAPSDKAPKGKPAAPAGAPSTLPPELTALIERPFTSGGLPLSVHAVTFPAAVDNVRVVIEVAPGAIPFAAAGDRRANTLDVAIVPVAAGGHELPAVQGRAALSLDAGDADDVAARGLRVVERLTLPPGRYQLRVAARERERGGSGAVVVDVAVPDARLEGLAMSSLVVSGSSAGRVPSANEDARFTAILGKPPTTARQFSRGDTLMVYAEFGGPRAQADGIELATIVRDAAGRELVHRTEPRAEARFAPGQGFAYAVDLPLMPLAPGDYVLRVEARVPGLAGLLAREVAFAVTAGGP